MAAIVTACRNDPHPRFSADPLKVGEGILTDWANLCIEQPDHVLALFSRDPTINYHWSNHNSSHSWQSRLNAEIVDPGGKTGRKASALPVSDLAEDSRKRAGSRARPKGCYLGGVLFGSISARFGGIPSSVCPRRARGPCQQHPQHNHRRHKSFPRHSPFPSVFDAPR